MHRHHWRVSNVKEIYFYEQGQSWENHPVTGNEDRTVCPSQSTSYYLRVVKSDYSVETQEQRSRSPHRSKRPVITSFGLYRPAPSR